jgi:putative lipoic acid-binding regulatory protein
MKGKKVDNTIYANLKQKLDEQFAWPMIYMFKFIVPEARKQQVIALFNTHDVSSRNSKNGNYVSLTVQMFMMNSQDVIEVYKKASTIDGLIAL